MGRGKIEYQGNLDQLFRDDIEKFIEYNLVDVELVVEFDKKLQFIDLCRGICHAYYTYLMKTSYIHPSISKVLLTYLRRRNLVAPNKPADREERMKAIRDNNEEKFIGAYVSHQS